MPLFKKLVKGVTGATVKPYLTWYLSKERRYKRNGLELLIAPGVFHPAFFFSTGILLKYADQLELKGKRVLELGAGNGLIAMSCAKKGAVTTATDINSTAVEYLLKNSNHNGIELTVVHSDLFNEIPPQIFDYIFINPPYYKRNPSNQAEHAWYCGENGAYFKKLFAGIGAYVNEESKVLMILNDECDLEMISTTASGAGFKLALVKVTNVVIERLFIFNILPTS